MYTCYSTWSASPQVHMRVDTTHRGELPQGYPVSLHRSTLAMHTARLPGCREQIRVIWPIAVPDYCAPVGIAEMLLRSARH